MKLVLTHQGEASGFELADGRHPVGGAAGDAVQVEPLPPSVLTLTVEADRLLVEVRGEEVHGEVAVDGLPLPRGLPRLLLPGEVLQLPGGVQLSRAPHGEQPPSGTASVFLHLLAGDGLPALPAAATLTCLTGPDAGRVHVLGERVVLGRAREADLRLRDRAASRRHARLRREGSRSLLEDLGSANGLRVSGCRVRGEVELRDGDVLELGRTLLRYAAPAPRTDVPCADGAETPAPDPVAMPCPRVPRWEPAVMGAGAALAAVLVGLALLG